MIFFGAPFAQAMVVDLADAHDDSGKYGLNPYVVAHVAKFFEALGLAKKLPANTKEIIKSAIRYEDIKNYHGNRYMVVDGVFAGGKGDDLIAQAENLGILSKKVKIDHQEESPEAVETGAEIANIDPLQSWTVVDLREFLLNLNYENLNLNGKKHLILEARSIFNDLFGANNEIRYHFGKNDPSWKYITDNGIIINISALEEWKRYLTQLKLITDPAEVDN